MAQHEAWQVGGSAAELYQRYLVPAIASLWAADLIDRSAPRPGERVLDVACGTGVVARLAAERMSSGRVVGLDINAGMLAVARSLSPGAGPSIEWYEGSALAMPFPDASFDLCLCQFGLQFFPDRPAAMREMFRVLQFGGRAALSVFSAIECTPVTNALADALDRCLRPGASSIKRSEHSLADADELRQLAVGHGFRDVSVNTVTQTLRFASPREYVHMQMTATPMARLVADMESGSLDGLMDAIAGDLSAALCRDGEEGLVSPQEAHVLLARK
jgi:ubiquinone/menaquinone biosynthesis C-methylase UbiE